MKKMKHAAFTLLFASLFTVYSCGPNGDGNSMDTENSDGEGAVDSTKIPQFDSASASIQLHGINKTKS